MSIVGEDISVLHSTSNDTSHQRIIMTASDLLDYLKKNIIAVPIDLENSNYESQAGDISLKKWLEKQQKNNTLKITLNPPPSAIFILF